MAPAPAWAAPYAAMAREDQLAWPTLAEVTAAARAFVDPALTRGLGVDWNPATWRWRQTSLRLEVQRLRARDDQSNAPAKNRMICSATAAGSVMGFRIRSVTSKVASPWTSDQQARKAVSRWAGLASSEIRRVRAA